MGARKQFGPLILINDKLFDIRSTQKHIIIHTHKHTFIYVYTLACTHAHNLSEIAP